MPSPKTRTVLSAVFLAAAGLFLSGCVDDGYVYESGRPSYRTTTSAAVIYDVGPGIRYHSDRYIGPRARYDRDHRHYSSRSIDRTRLSDRYIRRPGYDRNHRHDGRPDVIWRRDGHRRP